MIKGVSDRLARELGGQLQVSQDQVEVYSYGLQIIIGMIIKVFVIISLSFMFGILEEVLIFSLFFISLRRYGGGVHLSTYSRCLLMGTLMILSLSKIATINISVNNLVITIVLVLLLGCYCIIKWVPSGTEKKVIKDVRNRNKQKIKTAIVIVLWLVSVGLLINANLMGYAFASTLGVLSSFFLLTPMGYRVIKSLDVSLDKLERRCKNV